MFKKCSYCRHKIKCNLNDETRDVIKEMWQSVKDIGTIVSVSKDKYTTTITTTNMSSKNLFPFSSLSFQKYRGKWFSYTKRIDCIVLKCQLELIKKKYGY